MAVRRKSHEGRGLGPKPAGLARELDSLLAAMSQDCVETVIGRLATDEEARRRLRRSPALWLDELRAAGLELTAIEAAALAGIDPAACGRFARTIDPRLQRASLTPPARAARRRRSDAAAGTGAALPAGTGAAIGAGEEEEEA